MQSSAPFRAFFSHVTLALAFLFAAFTARGDVKLPSLFGDHMVLQQQATLPVWGWAAPGEKVTVTFANENAEATAGPDGKWRTDLPALAAGTPPGILVIAGNNRITIQDVLVGDVWLCSGQSNMEFALNSAYNAKEAVPQATDSQIRFFRVPHVLAIAPRENVPAIWEICSPKTAASFSAVGYFFAKDLRTHLRRPIGLIESNWGGTPAQAWTDLPTLEANPGLRHYADSFHETLARFPGGDSELAIKEAANAPFQKQWADAAAKARAAKQPTPPKPPGLGINPGFPVVLFDGMIAPLIPYAMKGVIWYQGEANAKTTALALEYPTLFPAMITDWRKLWHEGDFPFLYVQLANFKRWPDDWPHLREAQLKTLSLPKTGMAVIVDIGTGGNIHPTDKADVGHRLALAARHTAYGENIVYTGPIYDSIKVEGDKIRVAFKPDSIGGGLILGTAPWSDPKDTPVSKTELEGFQIAGADKKWVDATATIDGGTVLLSSPAIPNPVAVRYAWASDPRCNLYNKEGLPASPFRSDDWEPAFPSDMPPQ